MKKQLKNSIKTTFRSTRDIDDNEFKNWYYQLIQMYKNVLGNDIFIKTHTYRKTIHHMMYTINNDIITQYNNNN